MKIQLTVAVLSFVVLSGITGQKGKVKKCQCGKLSKCVYDTISWHIKKDIDEALTEAKAKCIAGDKSGQYKKIFECCKMNTKADKAIGKDIQYCVLEKTCGCDNDITAKGRSYAFKTNKPADDKDLDLSDTETKAIALLEESYECVESYFKTKNSTKSARKKRNIDEEELKMFEETAFQFCPGNISCSIEKKPDLNAVKQVGFSCMKESIKCSMMKVGFNEIRAEGLILWLEKSLNEGYTESARRKRSPVTDFALNFVNTMANVLAF